MNPLHTNIKIEWVGPGPGKRELKGPVAVDKTSEIALMRLRKSDCSYENGFPANIDWDYPVVVQLLGNKQGVVLYECGHTGKHSRCYLPLELGDRFASQLRIFD